MTARLGAIIVGVILCGGLGSPVRAADPITATTIRALGFVIGRQGTGTAFHVGQGCWMTADHVIDVSAVEIVLWTGRAHSAMYEGSHPDADLAILSGPSIPELLQLASATVSLGDTVWVIGFPGESRRFAQAVPSPGTVTNVLPTGHLIISAVAFAGHSGSPVLNRNGQVVGVLTAIHKERLDRSLAEPLPVVRSMVRRCLAR